MISLHWRQSQRWMVCTQLLRKCDVSSLWVLVSLSELLHLRKLRKPTSASRLERLPLESLSEVQLTRLSSGFYEAQSLGYTGNLSSIPLERCLSGWQVFSDPCTTVMTAPLVKTGESLSGYPILFKAGNTYLYTHRRHWNWSCQWTQ